MKLLRKKELPFDSSENSKQKNLDISPSEKHSHNENIPPETEKGNQITLNLGDKKGISKRKITELASEIRELIEEIRIINSTAPYSPRIGYAGEKISKNQVVGAREKQNTVLHSIPASTKNTPVKNTDTTQSIPDDILRRSFQNVNFFSKSYSGEKEDKSMLDDL